MGSPTIGGNEARQEAFLGDAFKSGLDLTRSKIMANPGVFVAEETAQIHQGMLVTRDANGFVIVAVGEDVFGVSKWHKLNTRRAVSVDEESVVAWNATVNLDHGNVDNVVVRVTAGQAGAVIPALNNYTLSAPNGTLTWDNPPTGTNAPANGATVFVTYNFEMTASDLQFQGSNFFNRQDDVAGLTDGRLAVIMPVGATILWTTQYDTSRSYTLQGTTSNLYSAGGATAALAGLFTNDAAEGRFVGKCYQLPTATDPFLGVQFGNVMEEQT
jgi:hypothetical protein